MDYIIQIEKIIKYLDFNLEIQNVEKIKNNIKKTFCNDINLYGCFIKDILTLENSGKISNDNEIFNDFVLCFENYKNHNSELSFLDKIIRYSDYYKMLIFEECKDRVLLNTITSINSCYSIEYYPFMMELIDDFTIGKIDRISYALMLQSITDNVFKNFENEKPFKLDLIKLQNELRLITSRSSERRAV